MSDQTRKRIASRLLARANASRTKQAAKQPEQVKPAKADTGPSVTNYRPDEPAWADPSWKPASTGTLTVEALERHRAAQKWAELRARYAGGGTDDMGNRLGVPPGFDPISGHRL